MMDERERLGRVVRGFAPSDDAFERLVDRRGRKQRNQRLAAGALGLIVALATAIFLARSLTSDGVPANPPVEPSPAPMGVSGALAYALDGDIYVADPDGTNAVKIALAGAIDAECPGDVRYQLPSWSPDGRYLAFQRECWRSEPGMVIPQAVVISDPDGTVVAEFPNDLGGFGWSPESTRVAVWETFGRTIGVYGVDGVRQASLPSPLTGKAVENGLGWMPDGSALLLSGDTPPPWMVLPLDGSPAYELSGEPPSASPDGTRVAVVGEHSTVITDADGVQVSEVDMPLARFPVWSPDGDRLASESRRGELVVVDVASGEATVLLEARTPLPEFSFLNGINGFSPQGDRILYTAFGRGSGGAGYTSLYSIGVDGSDARLLVDGAMQGQWRPR